MGKLQRMVRGTNFVISGGINSIGVATRRTKVSIRRRKGGRYFMNSAVG